MPQFVFKLEHKGDSSQPQAVELPVMEAAKCRAVELIGEDICGSPMAFWATDSYQVTVSDQDGLILFSVVMMSVTAPAMGESRPRPAG